MRHGVYTNEQKSAFSTIVAGASCLPFVVGTAPINTASKPSVNKIVQCTTLAEAQEAFSFQKAIPVDNDPNTCKYAYSLSEFMYVWFQKYSGGRVFLVNVLDPTKHKKTLDDLVNIQIDKEDGFATCNVLSAIASSVKIKKPVLEEGEPDSSPEYYEVDKDYVTSFDNDGYLVVTSLQDESGRFKLDTTQPLSISLDVLDPSKVTKDDIIGGFDAIKKQNTGLELISDVKAKFDVIPTFILSPQFSSDPEVASIMAAKATNINGLFNAIALIDLNTTDVTSYNEVNQWKNKNSLNLENMYLLWPQVRDGVNIYSYSCHMIGLINKVDSTKGGNVPYISPSNNSLSITGLCLADGKEINLGLEQANIINECGVTTAQNAGGFRAWGNRTACYPTNTDPKDTFLCVKRMFFWMRNTITVNMQQYVDNPGNKATIDAVVTTIQVWLNTLQRSSSLKSGSVVFSSDKNTVASMASGVYYFDLQIEPPVPMEVLEFNFSFPLLG